MAEPVPTPPPAPERIVRKIHEQMTVVIELGPHARSIETTETLLQAAEVMHAALFTIGAKDRLYGGAWRRQGWMGNLARIMSKTSRLKAMLWKDFAEESGDERVVDTALDLLNLCVFFMLNQQRGNRWGQE